MSTAQWCTRPLGIVYFFLLLWQISDFVEQNIIFKTKCELISINRVLLKSFNIEAVFG